MATLKTKNWSAVVLCRSVRDLDGKDLGCVYAGVKVSSEFWRAYQKLHIRVWYHVAIKLGLPRAVHLQIT